MTGPTPGGSCRSDGQRKAGRRLRILNRNRMRARTRNGISKTPCLSWKRQGSVDADAEFYQPNINSWSTTCGRTAMPAEATTMLGGERVLSARRVRYRHTSDRRGYSTYHVLPLLGNLTAASVIVPTVKGLITSSDSLTAISLSCTSHLLRNNSHVGIPQRDSATILSVSANGTTICRTVRFLAALRE